MHGPARERAAHLGPERRRPLVLDAALELFLERGYEGTSMDAIAAAAGVTKPVVYACYPGKAELFEALLRREEERVLAEIQAALPAGADAATPSRCSSRVSPPSCARSRRRPMPTASSSSAREARTPRSPAASSAGARCRSTPSPCSRGPGSRAASPTVDVDGASRLVGPARSSALAESGARAMLSEPERWTPETLGRVLGRFAVRGQRALAGVTAARRSGRVLLGLLQGLAVLVGVVLVGAGVPFAWIWIGSQLQGGTAPSLSGLGVAIAGIVASYWLIAAAFAWVVERARGAHPPTRYAWNRSMRDQTPQPGQTSHTLEEIVVAATVLVGLGCTIFFFLFGDPGVPSVPRSPR